MKIVTLVENTAASPLFAAEHGLSFYVEANGRKLLFDMGQSELFLRNAEMLGVSVPDVDMAFVSHGHYDHGGGLPAFLQVNDHAPIYIHRAAFEPHFSDRPEGVKSIGLDASLLDSGRFVLTDGVTQIGEDLLLFSEITGCDCCPQGNSTLYERKNGAYVPDRFVHEQSLILREGDALVLLTGCAHRGVVNICARAREIAGRDPDVVIGGMHLYSPGMGKSEPDENIRAVAEKLKQTASQYYTCHCTGPHAYDVLRKTLDGRMGYLAAGSAVEIG